MNKTFAIYTLGCKVNQEESAALANVFVEHGWRQLPFGEAADVCIVNTCTGPWLPIRRLMLLAPAVTCR